MEDGRIIQMYWDRNQDAIPETSRKYGNYCYSIAKNILRNPQDAEECVNDTWLGAWNAMPDKRPDMLSAFLGKITRNLAFNKYKQTHAEKRGGGEIALVLDELAECVSGKDNVEQEIDRKELAKTINAFLATLPRAKRDVFVCRYWYCQSVKDIARHTGMSETYVSVTLNRLRNGLKTYLKERGYEP